MLKTLKKTNFFIKGLILIFCILEIFVFFYLIPTNKVNARMGRPPVPAGISSNPPPPPSGSLPDESLPEESSSEESSGGGEPSSEEYQIFPSSRYSCDTQTGQCKKDLNGRFDSLSSCRLICSSNSNYHYICCSDTYQCLLKEGIDQDYCSTASDCENCTIRVRADPNPKTPIQNSVNIIIEGKNYNVCKVWKDSNPSNIKYCYDGSDSSLQDLLTYFPGNALYKCFEGIPFDQTEDTAYYSVYCWGDNAHFDCERHGRVITEISPPPTSTPPVLPCMISDFTINGKTNGDQNPIKVWLNQLLTGKWSTNFYCIDCNIDCVPDGCNWLENHIGTYGSEEFKITQKSTYTYTLTCWGENKEEDTDRLDLTVEAFPLPYWREIIPLLPGFLRGLFNR